MGVGAYGGRVWRGMVGCGIGRIEGALSGEI